MDFRNSRSSREQDVVNARRQRCSRELNTSTRRLNVHLISHSAAHGVEQLQMIHSGRNGDDLAARGVGEEMG